MSKNNYAKIAQAAKLIKKAADEEKPAKRVQVNEHNPRFDSLSLKDIVNLYGVKPERPADMDYKKNIIEDAHPTPVVFFQSHDRINSLVENENERQTININIIRKMPTGNVLQKRYATELALSLIRVATEMDLKDKEDLRILADTCASQLQKKAQGFDFKNFISERGEDAADIGGGAVSGAAIGAIAGGLIGVFGGPVGIAAGAAGGAAIAGALAAIFKTSPQAKNLAINAEIARNELADLIKDHMGDALLNQLDMALLHITTTASNYSQLVDKMHLPHATSADKHNVQTVANQYMLEIKKLDLLMQSFITNAKAGNYAAKDPDWLSKLKTPFTAILGDDVSDEVKALETLHRVIQQTEAGINDAIRESQSLSQEVAPPAPVAAPVAQKEPDYSSEFNMNDIEKELAGFPTR